MRWIFRLAAIAVIVIAAGLWITRPRADGPEVMAGLEADAARGETVFIAAGCASCHMAEGASGDAKLVLSGGQAFPSQFGTFHAPNISMDPQAGIGGWSATELWNALHHGTSPDGRHYYPALPYTGYIHLAAQDVLDLHAYMQGLPADPTPSQPHDLPFPFSIRASVGGWKLLFLRDDWAMAGDLTPELKRGRMIVEGMAHCADCHSPRGLLGQVRRGADWLTGAPNPGGRGSYPDLTPPALSWSADELVEYFTSGFTPDFDSAGGHMALVVENMASLPESDRAAVAAYLKALPLD